MIIIANQDTLTVSENQEKYSGSKDYYKITFQFSTDWDDFSVRHAVFIRAETEVEDMIIPEDGTVMIPNAFLAYETVIGVGCYGINGDTRRTTNVLKIVIAAGSYKTGERPIPALDIFQQYLDQMIAYSENIDPAILGKLIPAGGAEGQVLTKSTAQNYDVAWSDTAAEITISDVDVMNTSADERFDGLLTQKTVNEKMSADIAEKADILHNHDTDYLEIAHGMQTNNPHSVTKAQVGLGNVDNTADLSKPVSTAQQTAIDAVDQIFNYASYAGFPGTGKTEAVYIAEDTNKTYRWTGSAYAEIGGGTGGSAVGENLLINSSGRINQRGVSGTVTLAAGAYGHDRWKAGASGCTYTFSSSENITTFTITAGSLVQVVEGINIQSGTYVLSWNGTAQAQINGGTAGSSGMTAALTGGTNVTVSFGTGTFSKPKLESGTAATVYTLRSYDTELKQCFRYFKQLLSGGAGGVYARIFEGVAISATLADFRIDISEMRATPTFNYTGSWHISDAMTAGAVTAVAYFSTAYADKSIVIQATTSGRTAGRLAFFERSNNTTASANLNAEL